MKKQHKFMPFVVGLGAGALVGFLLRNSETADYNAGYQPKADTFNEKDYFTDDVVKKHQEEREARKAHAAEETKPAEECAENAEEVKEAEQVEEPVCEEKDGCNEEQKPAEEAEDVIDLDAILEARDLEDLHATVEELDESDENILNRKKGDGHENC